MNKEKTFEISLNRKFIEVIGGSSVFYAVESLKKQAKLYFGKNKWFSKSVSAHENYQGEVVFSMNAIAMK